VFPLTQAATVVTWWWEVTAPVWLLAWVASLHDGGGWWARTLRRLRVRWVYLGLGLVFHLGIAALLEIGPFSWASLALYPCFVHPWEWRRLARKAAGTPAGSLGTDPTTG
jgi:hypothetical protein